MSSTRASLSNPSLFLNGLAAALAVRYVSGVSWARPSLEAYMPWYFALLTWSSHCAKSRCKMFALTPILARSDLIDLHVGVDLGKDHQRKQVHLDIPRYPPP